MPIVFSRVEERLIHGQVAYSWGTTLDFDAIVVIDDLSARDALQKSLLEMACPRNKKLVVVSENEAPEIIKNSSAKLFLIAKSPITFSNIAKMGVEIGVLNIGSVHFKAGKREIFKTVYLSDEEITALKDLLEVGVHVEIQKLPTDSKTNVKNLI